MDDDNTSSEVSDSEAGFLYDVFDDAIASEGFQIEGYEIIRELNRGGMGIVYLAKQVSPERELALKVMLPHYADEAGMLDRFYIEVRAMASLDHAGILPVYEVSESDGFHYFSMKLAEGGSLEEKLEKGPLLPQEVSQLIREIANALHHAHQRGVLHRDLKPGNFLFDSAGQVYVSDFGVAKLANAKVSNLTQDDSFVGTPNYLPPEVAEGVSKATIAGDIYSLGAVMYECLLGKKLFSHHGNFASLLRAIVDEPIEAPRALNAGVSKDLETICLKALSKSPADRYSSAEEFASDLARWEAGMPIMARPLGFFGNLWRLIKRHAVVSALIGALAILAMVSIGVVVNARLKARENIQLRLHESLLGQAKTERVLAQPGFRARVLSQLEQAWELSPSLRVEEEAVAVLTKADFVIQKRTGTSNSSDEMAWSPVQQDDEQVRSIRWQTESNQALVFYHSGSASFWCAQEEEALQTWIPAHGQSVIADFLPNERGLLVAGSEAGITLCQKDGVVVDARFPKLAENPRFLTVSPNGDLAAFGGSEGLAVLDLNKREWIWSQEQQVARCSPLWTPDGRHLIVALGEKKRAQVLHAKDGGEALSLRLSGWPEQFACDSEARYLAGALDDGSVAIFDLMTERAIARLPYRASHIRFSAEENALFVTTSKGDVMKWQVQEPIGYHEWPREGDDVSSISGAEISPNGQWLLVSGTQGVEVYSIAEQRQTGFYSTENQRIDAATSAWWLPRSNGQILLQVPGAWEVLQVEPTGKLVFSHRSEARLPGVKLKAIYLSGDWLVEEKNEDGSSVSMIWPKGESQGALPLESGELASVSSQKTSSQNVNAQAKILSDGRIRVSGRRALTLTPPRAIRFEKLLFTTDGERLLGVGVDHQVVEWNLRVLSDELATRGFDVSLSQE